MLDDDSDGIDSDRTLIPAILAALRDHQNKDAIGLADELIENAGDTMAVLMVGQIANYLHENPNIPLEQLAMMLSAHEMGMELTEPRTDGQIVADLLTVVAEYEAANGDLSTLSAESQHIVDQWGRRHSSSALIGVLCQMIGLLLADMKLQMTAPIAMRRSPEAAVRFALADARSVFLGQGPLPVVSPEWNDIEPEAEDDNN